MNKPNEQASHMKRIAVIGSGISGLSAAWALRNTADVRLFEADTRLGGHACTVDIDYSGHPISVDVGFIVCNPLNYPNFISFMRALGIETQASDMSFAVSDPDGFEWSSNRNGIFAQKSNLLRPSFIKMLIDIIAFNKAAQRDVENDNIPSDLTLGAYLDQLGMNASFRSNYILPMGAAIWSTPEAEMESYPAYSFLNFFNNHKLIHFERPQWRTVMGGSRSYVRKIESDLGYRVVLSSRVNRLNRVSEGIAVHIGKDVQVFDEVVLACHAPEAHDILGDGFENQASILASVETIPNRAVLHRDASLMPVRKAAWASWNVLKGHGKKVSLTYWMNRLQSLDDDCPLFVTLNPETNPDPNLVFKEFEFSHPLFNLAARDTVSHINQINGRDGLWFAGAWMGHGFHEDGLVSGLRAGLSLGGEIPWEPAGIHPIARQAKSSQISPPLDAVAAQ